MAPECFGAQKKSGGGRFGARVKCLCCHGDCLPRDPQRWRRGQRTVAAAHGPAVACATSSLGCSEKPRFEGTGGRGGGGGAGGDVSLHSERRKENMSE